MQLLICDNKKISSYELPEKVESFYLINYISSQDGIQETINLEADNGFWTLSADETLKIKKDGAIAEKVILRDYSNYEIYFSDLEYSIYIQVLPDFEVYSKVSVQDIININIGSDDNNNIIYSNSKILFNHAIITRNNDSLQLSTNSEQGLVYVNLKKVEETELKLGDVIFIYGLKIIIMGNILLINNPENKVSLRGLTIFNSESGEISNNYTPTTEIEKNVKLFKDSDLFFHTPRLKTDIKEETVKIESPPENEKQEEMPMILTLGPTLLFGIMSCTMTISSVRNLISGNADIFSSIIEIFTSVIMLITSIFFPIIIDKWQKKQIAKRENLRQTKYKKYLEEKNQEISSIIKKQELLIKENNFSIEDICQKINSRDRSIWSREIIDNDFLNIKIGIGNLKPKLIIEAEDKQFSLYDDNLKEAVIAIKEEKRLITNVPVSISLINNRITPFIIKSDYKQKYLDSLILQLMFYHSGLDLKIVVFTNEANEENWKSLKYLPHIWDKDREIRFFASKENEILQVSSYLEKEYVNRFKNNNQNKENLSNSSSDMYKNFSEYYLIITDDFKSVKSIPIIDKIVNSVSNVGFSMMVIENSMKNLPSRLERFVSIEKDTGIVLSRDMDSEKELMFKPEYIDFDLDKYSTVLANIPLSSKSVMIEMPTQLSFLDMYNAGRIEHLNILSRWKNNDPTISLKAEIGMKENNKHVELDLHEKYHGPHGLIAGTTGSGKSEFIMTYILSMAINFHPYEVQFILIDYKGGGLAGAFENRETGVKIPHLAGTITNLDTSEMNRTLVSLQSELKRRQRKFNEARDKLGEGTIDIYKYQKYYREGKLEEPIPHLFVIADEFAELKTQQPEFMSELVSTARIGRSLGIHLILATQKPSGVVSDEIWSNTKFRVCLKVQDESDSKEMLKRPEAAFLRRAGNFYLQVGNDEIFEQGQSGWCGAKYQPVDRIIKKVDDDIEFINNNGTIIKNINDEVKKDEIEDIGEQLINIVKYLYNIAINENIKFSTLWLPSLSGEIYLQDLINKYKYTQTPYHITPIIGEWDKPFNQTQGLYTFNMTNENTVIYGLPGSGKENLLQTVIYSSCMYHSLQELQFYILDLGAETLTMFNKTPNVGDVILSSDKDKVKGLFNYLKKQIKIRKKLLADYSGDYTMYCKNSGNKLPVIVTIINNYASIMENFSDFSYEYLPFLLREGSKLGIIFIITANSTNALGNLEENFSTKILMKTSDPSEYKYFAKATIIPKNLFGRGVTIYEEEGCEFQTAYITNRDSINVVVDNTNKYLMEKYNNYKVNPIIVLPSKVTPKNLLKFNPTITGMPLGYAIEDVQLIKYDFTKNKINLILGENLIDNSIFVNGFMKVLSSIKDIKINLLDIDNMLNVEGNINHISSDFIEIFNEIESNETEIPTINIISGTNCIEDNFSEEELTSLENIINNCNNINNNYFIILDNLSNFQRLTSMSWYDNIDKTTGIWVGENIMEQELFDTDNLDESEIPSSLSNIIFIVENNEYKIVKSMGDSYE